MGAHASMIFPLPPLIPALSGQPNKIPNPETPSHVLLSGEEKPKQGCCCLSPITKAGILCLFKHVKSPTFRCVQVREIDILRGVMFGDSHSPRLGFEYHLGLTVSCAIWGSSVPFLLPGALYAK